MKVIKPPQRFTTVIRPVIFLAGSIEQNAAVEWQEKIEQNLRDSPGTILNPRRDEWDSSWEQTMGDNEFTEQVEWELDAMDRADVILMYFDPNTKSPITLMELGLHAKDGKMVVCCPEGFWRKGNVDIVCRRYNIPTVADLDALIKTANHNVSRPDNSDQ